MTAGDIRGTGVTLDVFAADEQSDHPVAVDRYSRLARSVLEAEGVRDDVEVSLLFVDEAAITALHERFLEAEGPTDVLAFPIEDEGERSGRSPDEGGTGPASHESETEHPVLLGDVVVCPIVAARNAVDHGVTFDDEIALLVVHGLLHLLGMDHEAEDDAARMERREQELLDRFYRRAR